MVNTLYKDNLIFKHSYRSSRNDSINIESKSYVKNYDYLNLVVKRLKELTLTKSSGFNVDRLLLKISICIYKNEDDGYSYN